MEIPQSLQLSAEIGRQPLDAVVVDYITVYNPLPGGEPKKGSLAEHAGGAV